MWIWIVVGVLVLAVLAVSYQCYYISFYSPRGNQNEERRLTDSEQTKQYGEKILQMLDRLSQRPYERVKTTSYDGLRLSGRYFHQKDGAPLNICFHGYRGTPFRDFSGGADIYLAQGHNVLLVEQRAHFSSAGHTITFGIKERNDCVRWAEYAVQRFGEDTQILLCGISMGAATVLMASELELPANVKGILADCPYTTPGEIIRKVCRDMKYVPGLLYPFMWLGAWIFGRFRLDQGDCRKAVSHSGVPILLIHGEDDRLVPCEMSRQIAASAPECVTLETFPGAGHGLSYHSDPQRYCKVVTEFSERVLLAGRDANREKGNIDVSDNEIQATE